MKLAAPRPGPRLVTIVALVLGAPPVVAAEPGSLASLAATERAFSRASVAKGMREAFLEFFADDGVNFTPHPTKTREALAGRPPTPSPAPFTLAWEPVAGAVSSDGTLGFTTGPYTLTPREGAPRSGYFSSVWRRAADGPWKVIVDLGVETPASAAELGTPFSEIGAGAPAVPAKGAAQDLRALDKDRGRALGGADPAAACEALYAPAARLHGTGKSAAVGRAAVCAAAVAEAPGATWEPVDSGSAASGDLGWVYGRFTRGATRGYYLRVYRRDTAGRLRVVHESAFDAPEEMR